MCDVVVLGSNRRTDSFNSNARVVWFSFYFEVLLNRKLSFSVYPTERIDDPLESSNVLVQHYVKRLHYKQTLWNTMIRG